MSRSRPRILFKKGLRRIIFVGGELIEVVIDGKGDALGPSWEMYRQNPTTGRWELVSEGLGSITQSVAPQNGKGKLGEFEPIDDKTVGQWQRNWCYIGDRLTLVPVNVAKYFATLSPPDSARFTRHRGVKRGGR